MLLGIIADDFTGASDIANTIAKGLPGQGGLRTAQFLGVPDRPAPSSIEAGVVALKTRSVPAAEAVAQSLRALEWLQAQGCRQIVFKYCSTFDSTPEGNIGPVGEALAAALGVRGIIACPAFPTMGRTVHQGHLFVRGRLLSESGMENHPLTPMTDPDLRRWLGRQCKSAVGLVPAEVVRLGAGAVRAALEASASRGDVLVIADAATDADLLVLGTAAAEAPLVTGGSGIALGLSANFIARGEAKGGEVDYVPVDGPEAILAGSCSGATLGQVELHAQAHPTFRVDADAVMRGAVTPAEVAAFLLDRTGEAPLAYSSSPPEVISAIQALYGRETVSQRIEGFFADVAVALRKGGLRRLVVAGGETSSAVAQALDFGALAIGPEIDPGVPILTDADHSIALALKSGNFGAPDFFGKALRTMEQP
ncbi:3-oxo-tetronate kinase [Devosia sediminis]|uniref:3-oxo-tetronate kinase n=1 Tax=Devosia sediminis TaxID=2798801 RepID=A0A934IVF1_9HYPH|nr:3-oxo-tetronate kinase [Devosia sediminis]MBJ3785841.1 four-carbon acid sugar kinase family protein [Devosia sediminis]